jgi:hypothetical protein
MDDRYRVCPECGFEQPEHAMMTYWKRVSPEEPWRFGYLARRCVGCRKHLRSTAYRLVTYGSRAKETA